MSKTKLGTLYWDDELGEGTIKFADAFSAETWIVRADALVDWRAEINRVYEAELTDWETQCTSSK